jgi:cytochrome c553
MLAAATSFVVSAEPSSQVAWTPETLRLVKQGSPIKGKALAENCDTCHAASIENTEFPSLHGQNANYLYKQLRDYKSGNRVNAIMAGMAAGLGNQDMADIAAWYSQQPAVGFAQSVSASSDDTIRLVERGDPRRLLTPCEVCHAKGGEGTTIDNPVLAGQKAGYLENSLLAFQTGARHNDLYQRMRLLSKSLTRDEIHLIASYYASKKP